jgi:hypothetical protein
MGDREIRQVLEREKIQTTGPFCGRRWSRSGEGLGPAFRSAARCLVGERRPDEGRPAAQRAGAFACG